MVNPRETPSEKFRLLHDVYRDTSCCLGKYPVFGKIAKEITCFTDWTQLLRLQRFVSHMQPKVSPIPNHSKRKEGWNFESSQDLISASHNPNEINLYIKIYISYVKFSKLAKNAWFWMKFKTRRTKISFFSINQKVLARNNSLTVVSLAWRNSPLAQKTDCYETF